LYDTFRSMLISLKRDKARPVVILLRSLFVGYLDEISGLNVVEERLADFLTAEGVLVKPRPAQSCY
jgi:hypothetical protein